MLEALAPLHARAAISAFAAAVEVAGSEPPPGVRVAHGDLASRFAVYRNNVAVARITAFEDLFPVCRRLVGDDFFREMVRAHLSEAPPTSPIVATWADAFPEWLARHPATAGLGWLVDTARLEAAWISAHHAAEAEPIGLADLAGLAPEVLLAVRVGLHPSLRLVASDHPIGAIWTAHQGDDEPGPLTATGPETVLILRPEAEVSVRMIGEGDRVFLERLAAGSPLAEAGEAALAADPAFDLGPRFLALVSLGAVTGLG